MKHSFQPGDAVIWMKNMGGNVVWPVVATVVSVTAKRVAIQADDPDERGEGIVTRYVSPASLQPRSQPAVKRSPAPAKGRGARPEKQPPPPDSFEARYPNVASWVQDGWIEIGHDDCGRPFLRAMDIGGVVWEGDEHYATMDDALRALDAGIAAWVEETS